MRARLTHVLFWILVAPVAFGSPIYTTVRSYDVSLEIDREARRIRGTETLEVHVGDYLRFPLAGQEIVAIESGGEPVAYTIEDDELTITLPPAYGVPPAREITIRYEVTRPSGLIFGESSIYTGFDTCTWMICDPSPGHRASLKLRIPAGEGEEVIASGTLSAVEPLEDGSRRLEWTQDRQYPPYLFGFVIGPLRVYTTELDGRIFTTAAATLEIDDLRRLTNAARGMVHYFEGIAGLTLPGGRYTQVVVEGSAAQEKSTFSLLGTNQLAALATDPTEDWLIAHELAHQFWGNLVTPASWSEMWLSEGVVTFLTAAWKEQRWGRDHYEREMELATRRVQHAIEEGYDVPLSWPGEYPTLRIRRAIAYSRGALFLDELRRRLGDELFWPSLRRFTRDYAGRSVTSRQFQRTFERTSGRELDALFDEWVISTTPDRTDLERR